MCLIFVDIVCDTRSILITVSQYMKLVTMFTENPIRTNAAFFIVAGPKMVESVQHVFVDMRQILNKATRRIITVFFATPTPKQ